MPTYQHGVSHYDEYMLIYVPHIKSVSIHSYLKVGHQISNKIG